MKRLFRFTHELAPGEVPDAYYIRTNNITNAKKEYGKIKDAEEVLIQIAEDVNGEWKILFETNHGWSL